MSLEYEPSSGPLHISAEHLFLNWVPRSWPDNLAQRDARGEAVHLHGQIHLTHSVHQVAMLISVPAQIRQLALYLGSE